MPNSKNFFKEIFQHIIPVRSQFHVLINLNWFLHSASNFDRSANLRALRARTLNVFRTLCAVVSLVSCAVRAHVPPVLLVLCVLHALVPHVPRVLLAFEHYVPLLPNPWHVSCASLYICALVFPFLT